MKVRFKEDYLENEKGERLEVSFDELLKGCLDNSFKTISISKIIFEGVEKVTKLEIIRTRDYGRTELYRKLEREIQRDSSYKQAKAEKEKAHVSAKEAREKAARSSAIILSNPSVDKYARRRALARMRPYKNYHRGSH